MPAAYDKLVFFFLNKHEFCYPPWPLLLYVSSEYFSYSISSRVEEMLSSSPLAAGMLWCVLPEPQLVQFYLPSFLPGNVILAQTHEMMIALFHIVFSVNSFTRFNKYIFCEMFEMSIIWAFSLDWHVFLPIFIDEQSFLYIWPWILCWDVWEQLRRGEAQLDYVCVCVSVDIFTQQLSVPDGEVASVPIWGHLTTHLHSCSSPHLPFYICTW